MKATKTIPIVMTYPSNPVADGIVASLERPGGNVTGISGLASGLGGKWLELVKETVPEVKRVAVLWGGRSGKESQEWKDVETAARALRIELQAVEVRGPSDLADAFKSATTGGAEAFVMLPHIIGFPREIAELAIKSRLPGIFWRRDFAASGGLMAYGANLEEQARRAAYFVDKILKGAKPGELPIEQPMNFELAINIKTAKDLGITIPARVLAWADVVFR
jgi:putative ABC transport system substrate-binding protein